MDKFEMITLYIGTYTRREPHVDGIAAGIYVYKLHPATGELTYATTVTAPGMVNPSYLAVAPDRRTLYAVNEIAGGDDAQGTVSAFAIDPLTNNLRYLNQQPTRGLAPCHVSVEPNGRFALSANYGTGNITVLPIEADGRLAEASDVVQFHGSGPNPERQEGPHAHMIMASPNGRFIVAVDLGTDKVMVYRLDLDQGKLVAADPPWTTVPAGSGARHLAFHPQQPWAYVLGEMKATVTLLHFDEQHGTFEVVQTLSTLPEDYSTVKSGAAIKVSPNGRFVYASNRGHDSLAIYTVDPESGKLSLVGHEPTQGETPRDFTIDPSGTLLLAANQDSDTVVSFWIDQETGTLTPTGHVAAVPTPVCLKLLVK